MSTKNENLIKKCRERMSLYSDSARKNLDEILKNFVPNIPRSIHCFIYHFYLRTFGDEHRAFERIIVAESMDRALKKLDDDETTHNYYIDRVEKRDMITKEVVEFDYYG